MSLTKPTGNILLPTILRAEQTASGTAVDFTGIPSGVKRIDVLFNNVSLSGTANVRLQLGDAGGVETSGYISHNESLVAGAGTTLTSSNGFDVFGGNASYAVTGIITLQLMVSASNRWLCSGVTQINTSIGVQMIAGVKALSETLDRIRVTASNGTDTFDSGTIAISYTF